MRISLASAALLLSTAATSAVPLNGLYGSLFGGYSYLPNNISTVRYGLYFNDASFDSGFNAGGRLGYKNTPLRYEGELTFIHADTGRFRVNALHQGNVSGHSSALALMANGYYDFPEIVPAVEPFLGIGIGLAGVGATLNSTTPFRNVHFSRSNTVFAWQATTGLTYNFSEQYAFDIAYRYLDTARAGDLGQAFQAHMATLGVTCHFDDANYK